jgi:FAD/FMN-containing dehydrogenase
MSNKIKKLKAKLNETIWTDNIEKINPHLNEQRGNIQGKSSLLMLPKNTADVVKIVKFCNTNKISIVPQGGRTGLCGGTIPNKNGKEIILSTEKMDKVIEVNKDSYFMIVQAGCSLSVIKKIAIENNRFFPLSLPSESSCTIGGNISTNAGGAAVLKYGMTKELVEGIEVVLPNGEILNSIKNIEKDNKGFDSKYLHIGSEGTLGIITKVKIRLFPEIKKKAMAIVATNTINRLISFLNIIKNECYEYFSSFEINTNIGLNLINKFYKDIPIPFDNQYSWYAIVELTSYDNINLEKKIHDIISKSIKNKIIFDAIIPQNLKQYNNIWKTRELLSEAQKLNGKSIKHDISIPIEKIPLFIKKARKFLTDFRKNNILIFGHLAEGNLHYNISKPKKMSMSVFNKLHKKVNSNIFNLVYGLGGSFSAEHGIGLIKKKEFKKYTSKEEFIIKCNLKKLLDPNNIMNPGKIFN